MLSPLARKARASMPASILPWAFCWQRKAPLYYTLHGDSAFNGPEEDDPVSAELPPQASLH